MPRMQARLDEIVATKYQLYYRRPEVILLLNFQYLDEVKQIYQGLGGDFGNYPPRIGAYDISTMSFDIELDEYLHFNRNRQCTLDSPNYMDFAPQVVTFVESRLPSMFAVRSY